MNKQVTQPFIIIVKHFVLYTTVLLHFNKTGSSVGFFI